MASTRGTKFKFIEGERVLCYEPDPTKAKVLYESKVLELVTTKDSKGRKIPEYLIHFNGWSSSWDRCVTEEFVLRDNEENRNLQKRLAEAAALNLIHPIRKKSKKKKRRLSDLLRESFGGKNRRRTWGGPLTDEDIGGIADEYRNAGGQLDLIGLVSGRTASGSGPDDSNASQSSNCSSTAENSEAEEEECKVMELQFPDVLKKKLEDGHRLVKEERKLFRLPCSPNVVAIIEGYVRNYMANILCMTPEKSKTRRSEISVPDKNINLCKEIMDGLRIYFDFTLPVLLLYDEERPQYAHFIENYEPPCEVPQPVSETGATDVSPPELAKDDGSTVAGVVVSHEAEVEVKSPTASPASSLAGKSPPHKSIKKEPTDETAAAEFVMGFPGRVLRSTASRLEAKSHANLSSQSKQAEPGASLCVTPDQTPNRSSQSKTVPKCNRPSLTNKLLSSTPSTATNSSTLVAPASPPPKVLPEGYSLSMTKPRLGQPLPPPTPPLSPPLHYIPNTSHCPPSSSSSSSPPPTLTPRQFAGSGGSINRTDLGEVLDQSMSWQMIPQSVHQQIPPPPSLIYGANHFLRLFVKLPQMLTRTNIADYKLSVVHNHLELFLKYMADCQEELFANTEVAEPFGDSQKAAEKSQTL